MNSVLGLRFPYAASAFKSLIWIVSSDTPSASRAPDNEKLKPNEIYPKPSAMAVLSDVILRVLQSLSKRQNVVSKEQQFHPVSLEVLHFIGVLDQVANGIQVQLSLWMRKKPSKDDVQLGYVVC
ncbi:hypothetical protein E8E11_008324 [Didymella keratinophila]|nr:hypothetical protein E8E11_008324 [Didymella keratinophila]